MSQEHEIADSIKATFPISLPLLHQLIDERLLLEALDASSDSRTVAASLLGLKRSTVVERMRTMGILKTRPSACGPKFTEIRPTYRQLMKRLAETAKRVEELESALHNAQRTEKISWTQPTSRSQEIR